jgi:sugar phosphate isomerase/epimerase
MAKISVSSWSLHRHIGNDLTLLDFPKMAREKFGVDAIELVNFQFESTERDYVVALKNRIEENGQKVVHIAAGHGNISQPDESQRLEDVKVLFGWLDLAVHLGAPAIRIDTGQQEGELDLSITIDSYKRLAQRARELGLKITLENHGGISGDPANLVQIVESVGSDVMGTCPDFGNFPAERRYDDIETVAPYAVILHAKTYEFDPDGEETTIDYSRCAQIFKSFTGYWSVEFEGPGDQYDGTKKSIELIQKHVQE